MNTTKLYQIDVYTKEWDAKVTSVEQKDSGIFVTLDQTAFFPEGGGQSCDLGLIDAFSVIDVQEQKQADGTTVIHTIAAASGDDLPVPGQQVHCQLNWEHRFDNMQRHCGEHILSGIFYRLYGGVNRGFHMGHDCMTIDISLEEMPEITELTWEMAQQAEREANQVIWSDAPVTVLRFDTRGEAEKMPLRKALAFDEDISIVSVGSIENAADCVACCGTHPSSAGQVGLIKLFKIEKYKGMFRVYFEAGQRALQDYEEKHNILTALAARYSSSIEEFPDKLCVQEEKLSAVKNELFHLKRALIEIECERLDARIAAKAARPDCGQTADSPDSPLIIYELQHFAMDDVFQMAKHYLNDQKGKKKNSGQQKTDAVRSTGGNLLLLYSVPDTSCVLVSDGSIPCGSLVKEYASFYQGKGGGSNTSARAMFDSRENAMLFADLLSKHLRG